MTLRSRPLSSSNQTPLLPLNEVGTLIKMSFGSQDPGTSSNDIMCYSKLAFKCAILVEWDGK